MLHEKIVIVQVDPVSMPTVDEADRFSVQLHGWGRCKIMLVTVRVGYREDPDIPAALHAARKAGLLERNLDLEHASYFLSRIMIVPTAEAGLARWRKRLFVRMAHNAASPIDHFSLPIERTVVVGSQVPV